MNYRNLFLSITAFLLVPLFFDSCKKDDSFTPIEVEGIEDKLAGSWTVSGVDAVGVVNILGRDVNATGKSKSAPQGSYILSQSPNNYTYDLKATLELKAGGLTQDFDYEDKDAGTWSVSEDEKSVIFVGNQGITQTLFFTQYDSNKTQYMRIAIPVDTTLNGFDYTGTVFVDMNQAL